MIYVDDLVDYGYEDWRRGEWCHMMSDTSLDELHEFAAGLGLKRTWYQPESSPHYDLRASKRSLALANGAQEMDAKTTIRIARFWRAQRRAEKAAAPCPYPQHRPHDRAGVGGTICRVCHPDPREPIVVYPPNLAWEPWPGWPGPKPHDTGPA